MASTPSHLQAKPLPTSIHSQLANETRNHPSRGRGAIGSVLLTRIFLGLIIQLVTLRTPCSQPAWSLFCYKPEVNRFYSSYKSVTKATVLISIINIHNSSTPAWQASWAALHKNWTLGIFMSCLLRSQVLWSWALKAQAPNKELEATWPPTGNSVTRTTEHICHLYEAPISTCEAAKFWRSPFPLNPDEVTFFREMSHTKSSVPTRA